MPRAVKHPKVILALNVNQTAAALGLRYAHVRKAIDDGLLMVRRCSGTRRNAILVSEIEAWVKSWPVITPRKYRKRSTPDAAI
jgi:hypothetical protein